ncbi:MAG: hypothetical protein FJY97_07490 [candidate division Zixibacteria bacterium]|nr:hypothetical protein [candidate division Zixibacteria bacterium]
MLRHVTVADSANPVVVDVEVTDGTVWYLGASGSFGRISNTGRPEPVGRSMSMPFPPDAMSAAAQQGDVLWVGTSDHGLFVYRLDTRAWQPVLPNIDITSVFFDPRTEHLYVGAKTGLYLLKDVINPEKTPSVVGFFEEFADVRTFQGAENGVYFLTGSGKIGARFTRRSDSMALWKRLWRSEGASPDSLVTLLDPRPSDLDERDITAACQSPTHLFLGTADGMILRYDKTAHVWQSLPRPLPSAVDELVFNPYSGSVAALAGNGLYHAVAPYEQFVRYYNVEADSVRMMPTPWGYLLVLDGRTITAFNETNHRADVMLSGVEAPEPGFVPVAVDRSGAALYFVTADGRVLTYDLLRHRWDSPPDIPHRNVVDIRHVGYQEIYQTSDNALYVPGTFPLIGGGAALLGDADIRRAGTDGKYLYAAGDRYIERYDMTTHTWEASARIDMGNTGAPTHLTPVSGKLVYRTGGNGFDGALWMDGRLIDRDTGPVSGAGDRLWYARPDGLYRLDAKTGRTTLAFGQTAPERIPEERIVTAMETGDAIWLATDRRILRYVFSTRAWRVLSLPDGRDVARLATGDGGLFALTSGAVYEWVPAVEEWRRIEETGADPEPLPENIQTLRTSPPERMLVDTALWQWVRDGSRVIPRFRDPVLTDVSVFDDDPRVWRFRFDTVRGVVPLRSDLLVVADGLLVRYPQGSNLALTDGTLSPGPNLSERSTVSGEQEITGTIRLWVSSPDGNRKMSVYVEDGQRIVPFPFGRNDTPTHTEILIDDGIWRWEKNRTTGRVSKYLTGRGGRHEFFYKTAVSTLTIYVVLPLPARRYGSPHRAAWRGIPFPPMRSRSLRCLMKPG